MKPKSKETGLGYRNGTPKNHGGPNLYSAADRRHTRELGHATVGNPGGEPGMSIVSAGGSFKGAGDFGSAIRGWVQDITGRRLPSVIRSIYIRFFGEVIKNSPVASGCFVSFWRFKQDGPDEDRPKIEEMRAATQAGIGEAARDEKMSELAAFASSLVGGKNWSLFMSNALPYARRVEYTGWAGQGPYAPIRKALLQLKKIVEQCCQEYKG